MTITSQHNATQVPHASTRFYLWMGLGLGLGLGLGAGARGLASVLPISTGYVPG